MTQLMEMQTVRMVKHILQVIMKVPTARHIQAATQMVSVMDMYHQQVSVEKLENPSNSLCVHVFIVLLFLFFLLRWSWLSYFVYLKN